MPGRYFKITALAVNPRPCLYMNYIDLITTKRVLETCVLIHLRNLGYLLLLVAVAFLTENGPSFCWRVTKSIRLRVYTTTWPY